ncbi:hypothetical protein T03_2854 [Trichinella britovi]|uniref:Uncharacterized protein n=1 Tax=Trichinella britovi TaxID=45882 RepID=A0A0V1C380_TRIBR|nr:hypothetical protein T03_1315 [Trichinella britovi]KRY43868.1 hypothetical protein T03_2854 [Trichinella britovi]
MLLPLDLTSHFKISKPTVTMLRPLPSQPLHGLAKVEEATLHPDVGKVALNGRDQGCFKIANKFRRIKLEAKFFHFGMEHFNIRLYAMRSLQIVILCTTRSSLPLMNR